MPTGTIDRTAYISNISGQYILGLYGIPTQTCKEVNEYYDETKYKPCYTTYTINDYTFMMHCWLRVEQAAPSEKVTNYLNSLNPPYNTYSASNIYIFHSSIMKIGQNGVFNYLDEEGRRKYYNFRRGEESTIDYGTDLDTLDLDLSIWFYSDNSSTKEGNIKVIIFYDAAKGWHNGYTLANMESRLKAGMLSYIKKYYNSNEVKCLQSKLLAAYISDSFEKITKTYTNSTWNTSKTWYIKVSYTPNSTTTTGSNVVNYVTMIRKRNRQLRLSGFVFYFCLYSYIISVRLRYFLLYK